MSQDVPFIVDSKKKYLLVLNIVKKAIKGFALFIEKAWAEHLIADFGLELKQRHYNITGETSAIFEYEGETIRLEKNWMGRYALYHGDWQPDPHWTGD